MGISVFIADFMTLGVNTSSQGNTPEQKENTQQTGSPQKFCKCQSPILETRRSSDNKSNNEEILEIVRL